MKMEKPIRMVLCDLDGTLLYNTKKISDRNKAAIRALRRQGILFGICSGRSAVALQRLVEDWGIGEDVDFVLGFNGGMFWDPATGLVEEQLGMEKNNIEEAIKSCEGYPFSYAQYRGTTMYATGDNILTRQMARRNKLGFEQVKLDDLRQSSLKFMAIGMPWTLNKWLKSQAQQQLRHCRVFRSGPFLLEFVHHGLSKLEGARLAGRKYGVALDEIMSFGNDNNDIEMLEGTVGVAMANALPAVKNAAAYVTASNRQDGVARFLESHVLSSSPK